MQLGVVWLGINQYRPAASKRPEIRALVKLTRAEPQRSGLAQTCRITASMEQQLESLVPQGSLELEVVLREALEREGTRALGSLVWFLLSHSA